MIQDPPASPRRSRGRARFPGIAKAKPRAGKIQDSSPLIRQKKLWMSLTKMPNGSVFHETFNSSTAIFYNHTFNNSTQRIQDTRFKIQDSSSFSPTFPTLRPLK